MFTYLFERANTLTRSTISFFPLLVILAVRCCSLVATHLCVISVASGILLRRYRLEYTREVLAHMLQTLTIPTTTARLDISRLLKSTPSPPPHSAPPPQPSISRSTSVPVPTTSLLARPGPPSHRTSNSSTISTSTGSVFQPISSQNPQYSSQAPPQTNTGSAQPSINIPQPASISSKRPPPSQPHPSASPAKKQSKWTPSEDALIIDLRGSGMKWEDISKRLPGRSAISCRLHYQNYLERRSEWDEEKKNRLARLYER